MPSPTFITSGGQPTATSLREKMLNMLVTPGDVFDEVIAAPPCSANWRVPTLLVCLAGIVSLRLIGIEPLAQGRSLSVAEAQMMTGGWPLVSSLAVCLAAFAGTFWSAFVLWFMGRLFLKAHFSFVKSLEVVGLTGIILALGTVITGLMIAASGDAAARPAFSLLLKADSASTLRAMFDTLNVFGLWATAVLTIGLSRLSAVTLKEAAFWVFSYWLLARIALILLA
jgi:hypothetical protein